MNIPKLIKEYEMRVEINDRMIAVAKADIEKEKCLSVCNLELDLELMAQVHRATALRQLCVQMVADLKGLL